MLRQIRITIFSVISLSFLAGCMNMPTSPSQITGAYTSGLKYEAYDCANLSSEVDSLARRENQLIVAQEQRIKTSGVQAFWLGYGQGDGIEASELANVRGEKESVRRVLERKKCDQGLAILERFDNERAMKDAINDAQKRIEEKYEECKNSGYESLCDKSTIEKKIMESLNLTTAKPENNKTTSKSESINGYELTIGDYVQIETVNGDRKKILVTEFNGKSLVGVVQADNGSMNMEMFDRGNIQSFLLLKK